VERRVELGLGKLFVSFISGNPTDPYANSMDKQVGGLISFEDSPVERRRLVGETPAVKPDCYWFSNSSSEPGEIEDDRCIGSARGKCLGSFQDKTNPQEDLHLFAGLSFLLIMSRKVMPWRLKA
jgi:hypothetical protein